MTKFREIYDIFLDILKFGWNYFSLTTLPNIFL